MLCEKCKENQGKIYPIYYGKKIGQYTQHITQGTQTTTTFQIDGHEDVCVCKECAKRDPREITKFAVLTLLVCGFAFFCIYSIVSPWNDMLCIPFGFVGFGLSMPWIISMSKIEANPGEVVAKEILKERLESAGFDTFWSVKEYLKLKKRL